MHPNPEANMTAPLDFYFDFSSPYGYLAAMRINELAASYGRHVNWHPILLGVVFKATGAVPLSTIPIKGPYALHDIDRTARFHGIPFKFPASFPISTQATARAMLFIHDTHGAERAVEFATAAYQKYFVDGINIGDPENVLRIVADMGLDPAVISEAINSTPIKEQLKSEIEHAMARGVFGAPFIFLDGEPFWGFDRFDQIEAMLKNGK